MRKKQICAVLLGVFLVLVVSPAGVLGGAGQNAPKLNPKSTVVRFTTQQPSTSQTTYQVSGLTLNEWESSGSFGSSGFGVTPGEAINWSCSLGSGGGIAILGLDAGNYSILQSDSTTVNGNFGGFVSCYHSNGTVNYKDDCLEDGFQVYIGNQSSTSNHYNGMYYPKYSGSQSEYLVFIVDFDPLSNPVSFNFTCDFHDQRDYFGSTTVTLNFGDWVASAPLCSDASTCSYATQQEGQSIVWSYTTTSPDLGINLNVYAMDYDNYSNFCSGNTRCLSVDATGIQTGGVSFATINGDNVSGTFNPPYPAVWYIVVMNNDQQWNSNQTSTVVALSTQLVVPQTSPPPPLFNLTWIIWVFIGIAAVACLVVLEKKKSFIRRAIEKRRSRIPPETPTNAKEDQVPATIIATGFCPACGAEVKPHQKFCPACGTKQ